MTHVQFNAFASLAADLFDDPKQNNGAKQGYQKSRNGNGIVDRANAQEGTNEVPGDKSANDANDDIKQRTLL